MYLIQHSHPMFILEELFCDLDDFCLSFEPQWRSQQLSQRLKIRRRSRQMSLSGIMTILIAFHQSYYRNFKRYYLDRVCVYWQGEFPRLPSYQRFVEWIPSTLLPLCVDLKRCFGKCTGISFMTTNLRRDKKRSKFAGINRELFFFLLDRNISLTNCLSGHQLI